MAGESVKNAGRDVRSQIAQRYLVRPAGGEGGGLPDLGRLFEDNLLQRVIVEDTGAPVSLKEVLEGPDQAVHFQFDGTYSEAVRVPFLSYVILTGANTETAGAAPAALGEQVRQHFSNYFDPASEAEDQGQFLLARGDAYGPGRTVLFMGYGIFAPQDGSSPIGRIAIVLHGKDPHPLSPKLGADQIEAGFYRGQTGLAFSGSDSLAPAVVDGLQPEHVYYLGKFPGYEFTRYTPELSLDCVDEMGRPVLETEIHPLSLEGSAREWDGAYRVNEGDGRGFDLYYARDARPSRMLADCQGQGPWMKIEGFLPEPFLRGRYLQWWLETDDRGQLADSILSKPVRSLVTARGRQYVHDWRKLRNSESQGAERVRVDGVKHAFRLLGVPAFFRCPQPGQYIALRESDDPASIDAKRFCIDWLNHACKMQSLGQKPGKSADGLANLLNAEADGGRAYSVYEESGKLYIKAEGARLFTATGEGDEFEERDRIELVEGERIAAAGMVMRFLGEAEQTRA